MISYQPIKPNSIIINEFDNFLDPAQRFNISSPSRTSTNGTFRRRR